MTRQQANKAIIEILSQYAEDHSDIRFHQMLFNLNLEKQVVTSQGEIYNEDLYGMESVTALKRIIEMVDEEKPFTNKDKDENGKIIPLYKRSSIDFRTIVSYDERMEEMYEDEKEELEEEGIKNYEDWLKYYYLTGDIMIMKAPEWGKKGYKDRIDYEFMCGPSIGNEALSDTIYIDWYIEQVVERAGYKDTIQTQLAENYHGVNADDPFEAEAIYLALIAGFKQDGFNVIEVHEG